MNGKVGVKMVENVKDARKIFMKQIKIYFQKQSGSLINFN